jgi:hypothetical protein
METKMRFTLPFINDEEEFEVLVQLDETGVKTKALKHGQPVSRCRFSCDWETASGLAQLTGLNVVAYLIHLAKEDVTGLNLEEFPV